MNSTTPAVTARSLHKRFTLKTSKEPVHALDDV